MALRMQRWSLSYLASENDPEERPTHWSGQKRQTSSLPALAFGFSRCERRPPGAGGHDAQEKPPLLQDEALGAPHGIGPEPLEPATALANVECCFATSCPPHPGQTTSRASAPTRWSTSKRRPQPRHVYSYSGIIVLRNLSRGDPKRWSGSPEERPHPWYGSLRSSGTARAGSLTWAPAAVASHTSGRARRWPAPPRSPLPVASRCPLWVVLRVAGFLAPIGAAQGRAGAAPAPLASPTAGRVRDCSGGHAELRKHDPLQQQPGCQHAQQNQGVAPIAHLWSPSMAARPCAISRFSVSTWRSRESHTVEQIVKTVGSSMR